MTLTLADDLTVDAARAAARDGHLDEAVRLLVGLSEPDAVALDLRARVHAQRGEYAEADACWARVQEGDPDSAAAAAGRRQIARIRSGRRGRRPLWQPSRVAAMAVVAAGAVAAGGIMWAGSLPPAPPRADATAAQPVSTPDSAAAASAGQTPLAAAAALDRIAAAVTLPGVQIRRGDSQVEVLFDAGVFARNDLMTRRGKTMLDQVGARLAKLDADVTIVGHSVPYPGGRQHGGSVVALTRAVAAARVLTAASGRPLSSFVLASADQADNPFPTAGQNRTVTLILHP